MTPAEIRLLPLSELQDEAAAVSDAARYPGDKFWRELPEDGKQARTRFLREALARRAERAIEWGEPADVVAHVDGCFQAAWAEGLAERLAEADVSTGSLADLVRRRLLPAGEAATRRAPSDGR